MRSAIAAVVVLSLLVLGGCASPGTAEDFTWAVECPKTVDKGSEFNLKVTATKTVTTAEGPVVKPIEGLTIHWQIHWTGGSSAPLRHAGETGEPIKVRARMATGPATILITSENRDGLDVKVLEATVEVK